MARRNKKNDGIADMFAEICTWIFEIIPTGWSLPLALVWLAAAAYYASTIRLPYIPILVFVLLGVLPALIAVLTAWRGARKQKSPFLTFTGASVRKYESELDRVFKTSPAEQAPVEKARANRNVRAANQERLSSQTDIRQASGLEWSLDLLRTLEWRRFELLVAGVFAADNWEAKDAGAGPDGGIDILLYRPRESRPTAAVQCKSWRERLVGVAVVRELFGVMCAEKIEHGILATCGEFSAEAEKFATDKSIDLISGARLLSLISALPDATRQRLLTEITTGDYTTPTCPSCREKLVLRESVKGSFWGCRNYPGCRTLIRC